MTFENDFGREYPASQQPPQNSASGEQENLENRSLFSLLGDVPTLLSSLVRNEINLLKTELMNKAKMAGIGVGLIVVALAVIVLAVIVLIISGVFALALVMPTWLAALCVAVGLLLLAAILIVFAVVSFKKFGSPLPDRTLNNVQEDIDTVTGKNS